MTSEEDTVLVLLWPDYMTVLTNDALITNVRAIDMAAFIKPFYFNLSFIGANMTHLTKATLVLTALLVSSTLFVGCSNTTPTVKPTATVMVGAHGRI